MSVDGWRAVFPKCYGEKEEGKEGTRISPHPEGCGSKCLTIL